jgi:predicted dehydrogenase
MIWIVGAGLMAKEYAKVLNALKIPYIVIGRNEEKCKTFSIEFNCTVIPGGIDTYLETKPQKPEKVIIAVGIEALTQTTIAIIHYGIKEILLEKPGVGYAGEIDAIVKIASANKTVVLLAYNRRFYASVLKAEEIIKEDGGVSSFNFEFTEWSHVIRTLVKTNAEWHNWFLGNSSHVIDTAFFLGGKPENLCAFHKGSLDWHPASSNFCGAGVSKTGALFSYHANWEAPGRWVLEVLTNKNRLLFKPMESLQIQVLGSVAVNPCELDDKDDKEFKPGLYKQTKAYLENDYNRFCSIQEQKLMIDEYYLKMSGYKK